MRDRYENCKHYNGAVWRDRGECNAGINVRELVGKKDFAWIKRIPCFPKYKDNCDTPCDKFENYTQAEIDEEEAEWEQIINNMKATGPIISQVKQDHKGESWQGVVECPVCQGKLHMSHAAYNGHVHGKCETAGCLSWME